MTTIAFDGVSVCADTRIVAGSAIAGYHRKVFRLDSGIVALCGDYTAGHILLDWVRDGAKPRKKPTMLTEASFELLWVRPDGAFTLDEELHPVPALIPYAAGTGADFAMAALHLGYSARQAVELACKLDTNSGGEIHEETLEEVKHVRNNRRPVVRRR